MACPICRSRVIPENQKRSYVAHAYTVINPTPYPTRKGEPRNQNGDELTLLIARMALSKKLMRLRKKYPEEGLRGIQVGLIRTDKNSASTGDDLTIGDRIELAHTVQALPYHELLAPKSEEELRKILAVGGLLEQQGPPVGYNQAPAQQVQGNVGPGYQDDDIPF